MTVERETVHSEVLATAVVALDSGVRIQVRSARIPFVEQATVLSERELLLSSETDESVVGESVKIRR